MREEAAVTWTREMGIKDGPRGVSEGRMNRIWKLDASMREYEVSKWGPDFQLRWLDGGINHGDGQTEGTQLGQEWEIHSGVFCFNIL